VSPQAASQPLWCIMFPLSNALWLSGMFVVGLLTGQAALNRNDPSYKQRIEEAKARLKEQAKEGPAQPDDEPWPADQVAAVVAQEEEHEAEFKRKDL
jgi:hypothetical protein